MKNKSAIIRLFIANSISGFAQGVSMIAIPWYFVDILEQPSLWGQIYLMVNVVSLVWGLYAGTLVDRYNRKHIFLAEGLFGCLWLLAIAAWGFGMGSMPTFLVALVFATTFFTYNIHYPALYAFVQEITDKENYARITSYLEIQGQLTSVAAGGLGAILLAGVDAGAVDLLGWQLHIPFSIEAWRIEQVFLLDGITYFLSFLLILPIKYTAVSQRYVEHSTLRERFQVGVDFLKRNPLIFIFGNAAYFVFVTTMVINFVLMPIFVRNYLTADAHVYAVSEMSFAFGAVVAGMVITTLFARTTTVMGNIITTLISATSFFLLMFTRDVMLFYIIMIFVGLANSGSRIMRVTYMFNCVPNQVLGRVQSVFQVINVVLRIAFVAICSSVFFVEHIHYSFLLLSASCVVAAVVLMVYYKQLVNLKTR